METSAPERQLRETDRANLSTAEAISSHLPRIYFFPGLACDERMIAPQRSILAQIEAMPWLSPGPEESIATMAKRYLPRIDTSTPFFLAGISFGGMIAQELATYVRPAGLILISTCRSSAGVPWVNRTLARAVEASPAWFVQLGKRVMPQMRRIFGIEAQWQVDLFRAMLADVPPSLIKWSLGAVVRWPGVDPQAFAGIPVLQIHAERDHILPARLAGPIDRIVRNAGHAMNVAHATEVNGIVDGWLSGIGASRIDSGYRSSAMALNHDAQ